MGDRIVGAPDTLDTDIVVVALITVVVTVSLGACIPVDVFHDPAALVSAPSGGIDPDAVPGDTTVSTRVLVVVSTVLDVRVLTVVL